MPRKDMSVIAAVVLVFATPACQSAAPEPESTSVSAATRRPSEVPTSIRYPTNTPEPSETPRPSNTPSPTGTIVSTSTPAAEELETQVPDASYPLQLGGHTLDQSLPYADLMHYAGMNWVKQPISYPNDASGITSASHDEGFRIQLTARGPAEMIVQDGFEADFADWVAGLVATGADAVEVWNEPNIERNWAPGHISPTLYTELLCAAYEAIKTENRDALVISGAPAPAGVFGGCAPDGCDDVPWLEGLYEAGASDCLDYIGAHHISGATSPSSRTGHPADAAGRHHSFYFLWQTEKYYDAFEGAAKLFYTSLGYASQEGVASFPSSFSWAAGTTDAQQAAWLKEAAQLSVDTGMVDYIMVWNIDFQRYGDLDARDGYAIIRPDGSCPVCESLHDLLGSR